MYELLRLDKSSPAVAREWHARHSSTTSAEVDKKLKFVESANKILKDLAISQLKGVTELEGLQPAILGLFTGKNGLNAEKFKSVLTPKRQKR